MLNYNHDILLWFKIDSFADVFRSGEVVVTWGIEHEKVWNF